MAMPEASSRYRVAVRFGQFTSMEGVLSPAELKAVSVLSAADEFDFHGFARFKREELSVRLSGRSLREA